MLRVGSAATSGYGVGAAQPVFLDAYFATGSALRLPESSLPVPTSSCVLATGKATAAPWGWYDTEGFPTVSGDGQLVSFGCYGGVALGTVIPDSASTVKSLVMVNSLGGIDASTTTGGAPYGGGVSSVYLNGVTTAITFYKALRTVVTQDGSKLFYSSTPGYMAHFAFQGGYGAVPYGGSATTWLSPFYSSTTCSNCPQNSPGSYDAHNLMLYNGVLYGTDATATGDVTGSQLFSFNANSPYTLPNAVQVTNTLPGFFSTLAVTTSPWSLVFEGPLSLYFADTSAVSTAHVRHYAYANGQWSLANSILFPAAAGAPIYSITGRNVSGGFLLYAVIPSALLTYHTSTGVFNTLAHPVAGVFRGVALAPENYAWIPASVTSTGTPTQSQTSSQTATKTGTGTPSGSQTGTPSQSQVRGARLLFAFAPCACACV